MPFVVCAEGEHFLEEQKSYNWPQCSGVHTKKTSTNFQCLIVGANLTFQAWLGLFSDLPKMETNSKIPLKNEGENIKRRFSCDVCAADFSGPSGLYYHKQSIHKGITFQCIECEKRFSKKYDLKIHQHAWHDNVRHPCQQCDYEGLYKKDLAQHTKIKHEQRRFSCKECSKTFSRGQHLKLHMGIHTGKIYSCEHCDLTFTLMQNLERHKKVKHIDVRISLKDDTRKDGHEISNVEKIKTLDCTEELFASSDEIENGQTISPLLSSNSNPSITYEAISTENQGVIEQTRGSVKMQNQNDLVGPKSFLRRTTSSYWKWRCVDCGAQLSTRSSLYKHRKKIHSKGS